uniref:Cytochrome b5 heme-binding domain-containing protein n=1 Tax=Lotharella globosa TaxID=91324 RepID=A0A7S3ZG90_9EUKA
MESSGSEGQASTNKNEKKVRAPRHPRAHREPGKPKGTLAVLLENIKERKDPPKVITEKELQAHTKTEDAWCSVAGHVLNLTSLIKGEKRHPGGVKILEKFAGKDATSQFQMFHYPRGTAVKWASSEMYVGVLAGQGDKDAASFLVPKNPFAIR